MGMKKWKKTALSLGLASSLVVPSFTSAAFTPTPADVTGLKEQEFYNVLDRLNLTNKEQQELAFKQQLEANDQVSEDTLIIKYSTKLSDKVHNRAGTLVERSFPTLGYDVVKLKKGRSLQDAMQYYTSQRDVVNVLPSYTYELLGGKGDPKADSMYHLSLLQIDRALNLAGDHEVTVAVIDSGIDVDHPDLKSKILPPYNAGDPANQGMPYHHGTHVSGIIGAEADNGEGGHGINPKATILPIDVSYLTDYVIAEGILYAIEQEADVINMSLGGSMPSPIMEDAVQKALDAGITVVAAAGNSTSDAYHYPAAFDGVISVGSTNSENELSYYSNFGPAVDIVAPGEDVYSTVFNLQKNASSYVEMSGTSMASPVVAGVVSLLLSTYPDLTPAQVEFILEQTAIDLGEAGYDLTFANGLVNPVGALQFDMNLLPDVIEWNDERVLAEGAEVSFVEEAYSIEGKLSLPNEIAWHKVELEEGQSVQMILNGAEDYDYKLDLKFYAEGTNEASSILEVNDMLAGGAEGRLFTAVEKGTLAIGVTDVNGNYSLQGKSSYELTLTRHDELHEDGITKNEPVSITELPFDSNDLDIAPLTFLPEEDKNGELISDKDYFTFSVDEPQIVSISLSEVVGIDSAINVYFAEDFYQELPVGLSAEELEWYKPWAIESMNGGRMSEGEVLTFEAMPEMEYVIETSSEPVDDFFFFFFDPFNPFFDPSQMMVEEDNIPASADPYQVTMNTVELPADEDAEQMDSYEDEFIAGKISKQEYMQLKKDEIEQDLVITIESYFEEFSDEFLDRMTSTAIEYTVGDEAEGYFQTYGDEDFYTFTTDKDAVYKFSLNQDKSMMPRVTIYEFDEEEHDLIAVGRSGYSIYTGEPEPVLTIALQKEKSYFLKVENRMYRISEVPYELTSTILADAPHEKNEQNDRPLQATIIKPNQPETGYFVFNNDIDMYYYKHRSADEILGFGLKTNELTAEQEEAMPNELKNPLMMSAQIVEDTNGNMIIDDDEASKSLNYYSFFLEDTNISGSFKAKENVGYFVLTASTAFLGISLKSYDISIQTLGSLDEDATTVVTNNIPSKPLHFVKNEATYEAVGYLNSGVDFGDKDYYEFIVEQDGTFDVTLDSPEGLDGVVTIYNGHGVAVLEMDSYGVGDQEISSVSLTAGTYYFEVKDAYLRFSKEPYTLRVTSNK
ncbi:S8 family peptidase [Bacillus sp. SCS-151]|uniref:S8 family peptidase n=1 Tax=Nanhaiella sioensis TaxID=3115293 RepID=UPI00397B20B3